MARTTATRTPPPLAPMPPPPASLKATAPAVAPALTESTPDREPIVEKTPIAHVAETAKEPAAAKAPAEPKPRLEIEESYNPELKNTFTPNQSDKLRQVRFRCETNLKAGTISSWTENATYSDDKVTTTITAIPTSDAA